MPLPPAEASVSLNYFNAFRGNIFLSGSSGFLVQLLKRHTAKMLALPFGVVKPVAQKGRDKYLGLKNAEFIKKITSNIGHNYICASHGNSSNSLTKSTGFIITISSVLNFNNL